MTIESCSIERSASRTKRSSVDSNASVTASLHRLPDAASLACRAALRRQTGASTTYPRYNEFMTLKATAALAAVVLGAAALWWRRHPSACPYGQRFWVEAPHPFITRSGLLSALAPGPGETILEVGPGTGYYSLDVARACATVHIFDLQPQMLDHTVRRA